MSEPPNPSSYGSDFDAIPTCWGLEPGQLVLRYRRAIRSYLGALLRNDEDADDVAQKFLEKMLKGAFDNVRPERGRFRDYLKKSVRNEALAFLKKKGREVPIGLEPAADTLGPSVDDRWNEDWRKTVLDGAWKALDAYQNQRPDNHFTSLLRMISEQPEADSETLADRLAEVSGQRLQASAVRKQISRARRKFAQLVVEEVKLTLQGPTPDEVEEELVEVGLMPYLRDYLPDDWRTRDDWWTGR